MGLSEKTTKSSNIHFASLSDKNTQNASCLVHCLGRISTSFESVQKFSCKGEASRPEEVRTQDRNTQHLISHFWCARKFVTLFPKNISTGTTYALLTEIEALQMPLDSPSSWTWEYAMTNYSTSRKDN